MLDVMPAVLVRRRSNLLYFLRLSRKLLLINQERSPGGIEIVLVRGLNFLGFLNISHLDGFWGSDWNPASIDWFRDDDVGVRLGEEVFVVQFVSSESQGERVTTLHPGSSWDWSKSTLAVYTTKASQRLPPSVWECQGQVTVKRVSEQSCLGVTTSHLSPHISPPSTNRLSRYLHTEILSVYEEGKISALLTTGAGTVHYSTTVSMFILTVAKWGKGKQLLSGVF